MEEGCQGDLIVRVSRKTRKRFIGCNAYPNCTRTFSLPQSGLLVLNRELCKHCNYPVVRIITKSRKPWDLCINNECPSKDDKYRNNKNKKGTEEPAG